MTLVSVVMPVFNGAAFLAEPFGLILAHTQHHLELIIVDGWAAAFLATS